MTGTSNGTSADERAILVHSEGQEASADTHMSLRDLAQQAEGYERMPLPLPGNLKRNVWACMAINGAPMVLLPYLTRFFAASFPVQSGFYRVVYTDGLMNGALLLAVQVLPYLVYVHAVGLGLALLFFLITLGMRRMVREPVHWLGWLPAVPSGIGVMGTAITVFPVVGVFLLTVVAWIIITIIWIIIIATALLMLGAILEGSD